MALMLKRRMAGNKWLRAVTLSAYRQLVKAQVFLPPPRVFVNSLPKAGTHLVTSVLDELPRMLFSGVHVVPDDFSTTRSHVAGATDLDELDWSRLDRILGAVRQGQYVTGHFPWSPSLHRLLADHGYRTIFVIRDPRDVVVSHAMYVKRLQRHFLHDRYTTELTSDRERILASINGLEPTDGQRGLEPIGARLAAFSGWLSTPNVMIVRFEDLVGAHGGGTSERQAEAVRRIARYLDRDIDETQLQKVLSSVWSPASPTFRRGRIAGWTAEFDDATRDAFEHQAGDFLVSWGYEENTP